MAVQQQPEAYLVGDPKWSMDSGAAARTRVVNHSRSSGDSTGPGLCPRPLAWLRRRCRLNGGRVHVCDLTSVADLKFLASTSDTEQTPGGASLSRDQVSQPQPPIGGAAGFIGPYRAILFFIGPYRAILSYLTRA